MNKSSPFDMTYIHVLYTFFVNVLYTYVMTSSANLDSEKATWPQRMMMDDQASVFDTLTARHL